MKSISGLAIVLVVASSFSTASAQNQGEALYNQTCVACHTIGGGRLIGPDLAGVNTRRTEAWIISFIQSSQDMIAAGDADAIAVFQEYLRFPMPNHPLSDDDVRAIIGYIARVSPAGGAVAGAAGVLPVDATAANIEMGENLFVGRLRLENGGPSCISCHNLNTATVMTGGSLAKDLTDAVSRLTRQGVDAMMASPPFPAMRSAFDGKSITVGERAAVIAFLEDIEENQVDQIVSNYGNTLLISGLIGMVVLMGFFFLIGLRGTKESVNQAIYDRQLKSA